MAEGMSAREFLERELRNDPNLGFAEIQERGRRLGLNIPPFLYGSARRALGLPARRDLVDPNAVATPTPTELRDETPADDSVEMETPEAESADDASETVEVDMADAEAEGTEAPVAKAPKTEFKNSAFQFAVDTLKLSPDLSFQDLKTRAQMAGMKMQPIVYGRAKALLGLVPTKPRQPRKKAEPVVEAPRMLRQVDSATQYVPPTPTPRPVAAPAMPSNLGSLEQLIGVVRELENDRQRLRAILTAIQDAVTEALSIEES